MRCYVLEQGQHFAANLPKTEISAELEQELLALCLVWQARDLHQEGPNTDDYEGQTLYDSLDTDLNPYHNKPRFHSQEEYDDSIKWRD